MKGLETLSEGNSGIFYYSMHHICKRIELEIIFHMVLIELLHENMNISLYILVLNVFICNFSGSSSYSYSPSRDGCAFKTSGICSSITLSDGSIRETCRQRHSLLVIQLFKLLICNKLLFLKIIAHSY